MSSYTPPAVSGAGSTDFNYSEDRDLTKISHPDGKTVTFEYDSADRLKSVITPTETIDYTYDPKTGNLESEDSSAGENIAYEYNGPLPISTQWSGPVNGKLGMTYDNNFWVTSESMTGEPEIEFNYDQDGLVTKAGALTLSYSPTNGLLAGTTLLHATDAFSYNSYGEIIGYIASIDGKSVYQATYIRDADGRVTGKTEVIDGKSNAYAYNYDAAGRLGAVNENGEVVSTYVYDTNSNRLKTKTSSGTTSGTYDAQDRMMTYGAAKYAYTGNGELISKTVGTQTTKCVYDVLGNLIDVTLPNKAVISYVIDAEDRRVGKKKNGVLEAGFLYDGNRIVAQISSDGQIESQFIYGSHSTSPDYMINGGVTYRIFSDRLGSPRLVVNASTGAIVEEISYDEFGKVLSDTNPSFQPFGFAGGLYDQDTKLLRFGSRDYDPGVGRWTAKDPLKFAGGDSNLYGYASEDPINVVDPSGLGGVCQRIKEKVKEAVKQKASKVPLLKAPGVQVDMHTDTPMVSVTTGVEVEVDGQKVGEVTATGTVGVTQDQSPRAPLFSFDLETSVIIFGKTLWRNSTHKEGVTPENWGATKSSDSYVQYHESAACTDSEPHGCSGTPYDSPH
jgi:RHS repeat-associated protein